MLRVMAKPSVAAISKVEEAVSGTTRKTMRCTRLMLRTVWVCSSPNLTVDRFDSAEVSDFSGVTWFARRRRTARQSPELARVVMASSCDGSAL